MTFADTCGWLVGRTLRVGVHGEWGAFRRGLQTALVGAAVIVGGAGWLAFRWWDDIAPMIAPPPVTAPDAATHRLAGWLDAYNQCYVRATVNGVAMTMLVDSGASVLSFSREMIWRAGIDPGRLRYDQRTSTANGIGRAAAVTLAELRLGSFVLRDVPAAVDYAGMDAPLLGASVLKYLHFEIGRGACALRW